MARPRNRVYDDKGDLVEGLSSHKSSGRYYSLDQDGQRRYWGKDKSQAIREYRASLSPRYRPPMTDEDAAERLESEGLEEHQITPELIDLVKSEDRKSRFQGPSEEWLQANPNSRVAVWIRTGKYPRRPEPEVSKERLTGCFDEWWSIMLEAADKPTVHMKDVKRVFDRFAVVIGNKPISTLSADDFAAWRTWVTREQTRCKWSNKTHNDHHKHIKTVFNTVKSERPSWPFPDGLAEWQTLPKRIRSRSKYVPKRHNKQPIPVDVFQAVLTVAQKWAEAATVVDATDNNGRSKKRANRGRHNRGLTALAMFKLAANCGLDNTDTAAVTWDHIKHLDGSLPYLDMPREKIKKRFRVEVDRKIPLLPSTVVALKRLRDAMPVCETVFRTVQGSPHSKNSVYDQLEDAMIEAGLDSRFPDGVNSNRYRYTGKNTKRALKGEYKRKNGDGWTFKHIRNIGGKKRKGISKEERDHFLGHVEAGETKWYTGEVDESYLLPLVEAIGVEYFDDSSSANDQRHE